MATLEKLERFRSYNRWLQERFGERVYKVIVDAGFTCPNRDGTVATGGCTYCNNSSFRPPSAIKTDPIRDQVRDGIAYIRKRFHANKFIIYFQPFSNTYAETEYLRRLYTDAIDHPEVVGLAIGTRADCVDEEKIRMIDGKRHTILRCSSSGSTKADRSQAFRLRLRRAAATARCSHGFCSDSQRFC